MKQILGLGETDDSRGKKIRKQYVGWFVAAIFFFLFTHALLFISLTVSIIYSLNSFAMFMILVAPASLSGVTHYAARTFSSVDSEPPKLINWRHRLIFISILAVVAVGLIINLYVGQPVVNQLTSGLALVTTVAFYTIAGLIGWDRGAYKTKLEYLKNPPVPQQPNEINPYQILYIGSFKKFGVLTIFNIILAIILARMVSVGIGVAVFFGLPAYYDLIIRLNDGIVERE